MGINPVQSLIGQRRAVSEKLRQERQARLKQEHIQQFLSDWAPIILFIVFGLICLGLGEYKALHRGGAGRLGVKTMLKIARVRSE
jgi:hypothetical protein